MTIVATVTDNQLEQANSEHQDVIRLFEEAISELAGATAELDQADAKLAELLAADDFDADVFARAQAKTSQLRQRHATLQARVEALRRRGEDAERRRNELMDQHQRAEHARQVAELEAEASAANAEIVHAMRRMYQSLPADVRDSMGSWSWLFGGSDFATYAVKMYYLQRRAIALGVTLAPYGPGIVGLCIRKGMFEPGYRGNPDPLAV